MLSLLLDEHVSPRVGEQLRRKHSGLKVYALCEWRDGDLMGAGDDTLLSKAREDNLTLVSYDQRTIAPLLKNWLEQGMEHAGVIFIDARTIPPQQFGGLVRSLGELWTAQRLEEWTNRITFLTRSR